MKRNVPTQHTAFLRLALRLARRGYGRTSPNPMVGAVLVKSGTIIGRGWHQRAGGPHAEIEAILDAGRNGHSPNGATLYVTLEPCSTHGRTPPCTDALIAAGIQRVVAGAKDPNPRHAGRGFAILRRAGVEVELLGGAGFGLSPKDGRGGGRRPNRLKAGLRTQLAADCVRLNEAFNHWIVHRTPFVTVKTAMTLDGKIATARGESKWITGPQARACAMTLRQGADAVLVGINTVLADNPSLTVRSPEVSAQSPKSKAQSPTARKRLRRIILDSRARTPLTAKVVSDAFADSTTIVVGRGAPRNRLRNLSARVTVWTAPTHNGRINLRWLLKELGAQDVTSLLVEGGGEVNASFLLAGLAHRIAFFYAPTILGDRAARQAVAGDGARQLCEAVPLRDLEWCQLGPDLLLTARVDQG